MGKVILPQKVKLICGILASGEEWRKRGRKALSQKFGPMEEESGVIPFDFSAYYNDEMGEGIIRQWVSFKNLIGPQELAGIKLATNKMEEELSEEGKRRVNLDPGYVDLSKMVLATTKDATYRIYLGEGIYAQPTLFFRGGSFRPWEWTYPDYRGEVSIEFFNRVRKGYKQQISFGI